MSNLRSALALTVAFLCGLPAVAQQVDQDRGVDPRVDYKRLLQYGPWDDRNYNLTVEDLEWLAPNEAELQVRIPAFFRVLLRRYVPGLRRAGQAQYPRSAPEVFRKNFGGLLRDGEYEHPVRSDQRDAPVNGEYLVKPGAESAVAINPVNPDILVAGFNAPSIDQEMMWSEDGGQTWSSAGLLPASCCDPTVGWSSDGTIAYTATLASCSWLCNVEFYRSTDFGQTWAGKVTLTNAGVSDKEYLHVDTHLSSSCLDTVYLSWHDSNTMQFARSTDLGVSFHTPIGFGSDAAGIGSDIATDTAGTVFYLWPGVDPPNAIWLRRSTDCGATFPGDAVQVALTNGDFDFAIPAMEERRAWIYVSADADLSGGAFTDSVYAAWTDTTGPESVTPANNHTMIQVAYSRNGGSSWTVVTPHATDDMDEVDRFNQWMEVDQQGVIHLVYYSTEYVHPSRTSVDLVYVYSQDGGQTWSEPTRVTSQSSPNIVDDFEWGDYNGLDMTAAKVIPIWTDNRSETEADSIDVYVADLTNVTGSPDFYLSGSKLAQTVCAGDPLEDVTIQVGVFQGFSSPVSLAYDEPLPTGFGGSITPGTVDPVPGSAAASLSTDPGTSVGTHDITVLGTAENSDGHDLVIRATVQTEAAGAPALLLPADGEPNAGTLAVPLSWDAVAGATGYHLQVSLDPAFAATEIDEVVAVTSFSATGLSEGETYHWRVATVNACGEGAFGPARSFTASAETIYLVIDSTTAGLLQFFTDTLDAIGVSYAEHGAGTPTAAQMMPHPLVVWTCGTYGDLTAAEEAELQTYLDSGGKLFLSAQDYLWQHRPDVPPFGQSVLGIGSVANDGGDYSAVDGTPVVVFEGLGPMSLSYPSGFYDYSDEISAGGPGRLVLEGTNGRGAATATRSVVFFAFPFEALANNGSSRATSADAQAVMDRILRYLVRSLFIDGFETGDLTGWSNVVGAAAR